jgi:L,D-peptidoglycan transpeptidase YkuD (ErfK/YbiS/YcfS/YnhG family)
MSLAWKLAIPIQLLVSAVLGSFLTDTASAETGHDPSPQLIVVSAPDAHSTKGTLTAFQRAGAQWRTVFGPLDADLGSGGVGAARDNSFITPEGTFPLGQAFGREPNPGTSMPYFQTTDADWWDEDEESDTYNMHVRATEIDSEDAENLYDSGAIYDYAVLIDHNPQRVPGKSAGIFVHVTDGGPTWGCVAIDGTAMRAVLQWLDPHAVPQITIGVGIGGPPVPR